MLRSLFFKLLGAYSLVIGILALVAVGLANRATINEFRNYSDRSGQVIAQSLAPALADYYSQNSTWNGVSKFVENPSNWADQLPLSSTAYPTTEPTINDSTAQQHRGMGSGMRGMGMGATQAPGAESFSNGMGSGMGGWQGGDSAAHHDMWTMMGQRIFVTDASGVIVSDSYNQATGSSLTTEQLASAQPIQVGGQTAGTVLVGASDTDPGTPAGDFLRAVNRSIFIAVLVAGAAALLLGSLIFFQITAPLRKLKAASSAIAAGDLSQRVPVQTQDELGDLAKTFNQMAESLSLVQVQRQQMVADVAHELRTPLSVMQASLEGMQDGLLPLDAEQVASLHEETLLLNRLVADLRLLSSAETGQLKLERVELQPADLVFRATERMARVAEERGIQMAAEPAEGLAPVYADADRISQVIGNLISNALRYTPAGGSVLVKAEPYSDKTVSKNAQAVPTVLISVTDTGSGISAEDLPFIFDRFYRADKSRSRASGGSGLGLAIVKYIVEAHGGRVWAESPAWPSSAPQNCGSKISFTLPTGRR